MWELYKKHSAFVLGFHGCDRAIGEAALLDGKPLKPSINNYDWLGSGIYFWEGSPERARQFAEEGAKKGAKNTKGKITHPFVLGAIIDLQHCCNLLDSSSLEEIRIAYHALEIASRSGGVPVPQNLGPVDRPLRNLDCAVMEVMHALRKNARIESYDSVRAAFLEGESLYPNAGFASKAHIQIAVRNPRCIRGYFRPIED